LNGQKIRPGKYSIKRQKRAKKQLKTDHLFREVERKKQIKEHRKELEKGNLSEEKADLALNKLMAKLGKTIIFIHSATEKDSHKDNSAIDHMLILISPEHERIEFQIKSSDTGARNHKERHPNIPVVVIRVSKEEIDARIVLNSEEAEKEILDKLFKEYFIKNYDKTSYEKFLRENYE